MSKESCFKDQKLRRRNGDLADAMKIVNDAELILIYFSGHWCPPCRGFTPLLKDWYTQILSHNEVKTRPVVIFVSCDQDAGAMDAYFKKDHGDYYAVIFDNDALKDPLQTACKVEGIPKLSVVDKKGDCLYADGCDDMKKAMAEKKPFELYQLFLSKYNKE